MTTATVPAAATALPDLPPAYRLAVQNEPGAAFAHACRLAPDAGAGTLVWVPRPDVLELAVVLEPDEALRQARRAFFAGMVATADAIAAACAPEKPIGFDWPDAIRFDGARLGGGRLGWPENCGEADVPGWLVFSIMLIASKQGAGEPGLTPDSTALDEEGCAADGLADLAGQFARYLMRSFDTWYHEGFDPIGNRYLARLNLAGTARLEENGDLILRHAASAPPERMELLKALRVPSWLDEKTGRPHL
ncbi:biotin/lipoate--protein ligase family protein [Geminicoccus harenae]|uniref:biotin/lipoate--protein ligase family protein n=1 Tax=Geminicoccus harenae TaxID=2498453 RepID=UPI001C93DF16|nr:biotin/lipoate--protein ligase family protein [Geminicoccus harenae]